MIVAKNPKRFGPWQNCKEYAGRALGNRNPKNYVTVTIWSGYNGEPEQAAFPRIAHRAEELQNYLNTKSEEFGSTDRFRVFAVDGYDGILQIRVPPDWCNNRVITHLFYTYVRKFLTGDTRDDQHLQIAEGLLTYGKKVGMKAFNNKLRDLLIGRRLLGIVAAQHRYNATH